KISRREDCFFIQVHRSFLSDTYIDANRGKNVPQVCEHSECAQRSGFKKQKAWQRAGVRKTVLAK
ncbi:MAG: hypothetical protein SPJ63_01255, partial [Oscillospiraceae bacterium]|nr:hypothetical protein [Oscillospiraceae bacterium]